METKIKVEELMNAEETRDCQPYKKNAVVDFMTDDVEEETIGDRILEEQPFLEPGRYRTADRAYRLFPGNQTSAEKQI
eukprot:15845057-Heterocapsa_arctica.AAC.1